MWVATEMGPDRFSRFHVYWIQTNKKQTHMIAIIVKKCLGYVECRCISHTTNICKVCTMNNKENMYEYVQTYSLQLQ